MLEKHLFVVPFWVAFWCHFGSPSGAKLEQKSNKQIIKKAMIFKSGQDEPKGGFGRVLGWPWGGLGRPRGHFGGILGAKNAFLVSFLG